MRSADFDRVVADVVAHELAHSRRASVLTGPLATLSPESTLDATGLGVDSLELLACAGALNELFHLHETNVGDYLLQHRSLRAWAEVAQASWRAGSRQLTFRTSGSTGEAKPCSHAWSDLQREVQDHATTFPAVTRIVSFVPSHHIFGFLFTAGLAAELDVSVLDARRRSPAELRSELRGSDLIVATPTLYDYLLRSVSEFPAGIRAVTSTSPCPPALFRELQRRGVAVTEVYGSSETAGIGRRSCVDAPFALLPAWERDADGLRRAAAGALRIIPPDELEWCDPRHFFVSGRRDGAVQVGGINVFPARIAARIAQHPGVADCAVRLMRPDEGTRLKAYIVPRSGDSAPPRIDLERWLLETFTAAERPTALTFGPALPRSETGKPLDWDTAAA